MNASKIIAAAALSLLAAAGAHAETYEGVHSLTSSANRSSVAAEAVVAARAGNVYGDGANSGAPVMNASVNRAVVHAEAVAVAHNPLQGVDRRAFYRDQVPAGYGRTAAVVPTVQAAR